MFGHGSWTPSDGYTKVPRGGTVINFTKIGDTLDYHQALGIAGGSDRIPAANVWKEGQMMPDFALTSLGLHPDTGLPLSYLEGSTVVNERTLISDLLEEGDGTCSWLACASIKKG
ncbi:putative adhesin [Kitasatospora sp. NPDC056531]|uniref:putative adhesin n=1 Tax=Kitasatospora sp. NPDC056531 TaxID=3345856 RepID=UPI003694962B